MLSYSFCLLLITIRSPHSTAIQKKQRTSLNQWQSYGPSAFPCIDIIELPSSLGWYRRMDVQGLTALFRQYDSDNSGSLEHGEVVELLKAAYSPEFASIVGDYFLQEADIDGDGSLKLNEFLLACFRSRIISDVLQGKGAEGGLSRDDALTHPAFFQGLLYLFKKCDKDKDGNLDPEEVLTLLEKVQLDSSTSTDQKELVSLLIRYTGLNEDGQVNVSEFSTAWLELLAAHASQDSTQKLDLLEVLRKQVEQREATRAGSHEERVLRALTLHGASARSLSTHSSLVSPKSSAEVEGASEEEQEAIKAFLKQRRMGEVTRTKIERWFKELNARPVDVSYKEYEQIMGDIKTKDDQPSAEFFYRKCLNHLGSGPMPDAVLLLLTDKILEQFTTSQNPTVRNAAGMVDRQMREEEVDEDRKQCKPDYECMLKEEERARWEKDINSVLVYLILMPSKSFFTDDQVRKDLVRFESFLKYARPSEVRAVAYHILQEQVYGTLDPDAIVPHPVLRFIGYTKKVTDGYSKPDTAVRRPMPASEVSSFPFSTVERLAGTQIKSKPTGLAANVVRGDEGASKPAAKKPGPAPPPPPPPPPGALTAPQGLLTKAAAGPAPPAPAAGGMQDVFAAIREGNWKKRSSKNSEEESAPPVPGPSPASAPQAPAPEAPAPLTHVSAAAVVQEAPEPKEPVPPGKPQAAGQKVQTSSIAELSSPTVTSGTGGHLEGSLTAPGPIPTPVPASPLKNDKGEDAGGLRQSSDVAPVVAAMPPSSVPDEDGEDDILAKIRQIKSSRVMVRLSEEEPPEAHRGGPQSTSQQGTNQPPAPTNAVQDTGGVASPTDLSTLVASMSAGDDSFSMDSSYLPGVNPSTSPAAHPPPASTVGHGQQAAPPTRLHSLIDRTSHSTPPSTKSVVPRSQTMAPAPALTSTPGPPATSLPRSSTTMSSAKPQVWCEKPAPDGGVFYYNVKTKATSWDKPVELMTPEEELELKTQWRSYRAPDGKTYYVNKVTNNTQWTMPEDLRKARQEAGFM